MANLSPNLQHLTDELPTNRRAEVEQAIASSPYLRQIMTEAISAGTLEHIRMGTPGANEGGHYDDQKRAIYLSPETFTLFKQSSDRLDAITSTLGHETGHALNAEQTRNTLYFVTGSITDQIRAAEGGKVDMTPLMGTYLRNMRGDEASAEIHGWNALASRIEYTKAAPPGRSEMLRRADPSTDCVFSDKNQNRHLASGIILDTDMQISDTRLPKVGPINLEPVAKCHFDNPRATLGAGGAADYPNYYAAYMIQQIADDTRDQTYPARIEINMEKLGLDKTQLESTGLRLGNGGFFFTDISNDGHKPVVLRSSGSGIQGTPDSTEVALDEVRTRALGDDAPQQVSPERTITQATPEERDAREQAQREANRQGLSQEEAQQAVHAAVGGATRATSPEQQDVPQTQRERAQDVSIAQGIPQAATVAATLEREQTAAKIEPATTLERQNETQTPISADREPQDARTAATPALSTTHDPDALRLGNRGDSVEVLQYRLDRQGYRGPDGAQIPQTGQYGPETEHAVRQFQTMHGIPATGIADQDTRDTVDRSLAVQREHERGEQGNPNRSPSPESTPASETPEPAIAPRTVGLSASSGREAEDRNEREPQRAEAQPAALTTTAPDPALAHRTATQDDRQAPDKQTAAPLLDNPTHPNHGMYATLLKVVHERDHALGRTPDEHSKQLAGALTERALSQGLTTIGAVKFSDDGKVVGMTDTPNLSAEWARTSAGNAAEMAGRPLAQSSEGAAKLTEQMEQARALQAQTQTQIPPTQDDPAPKGPKL